MSTKIAVLGDIHFDSSIASTNQRHTDIADTLLLRAVHRLNRMVKPDLTVVVGDLHNAGEAANVEADYQVLRRILDKLESPWIIIPGNHDNPEDQFYTHFPRPAERFDVAGIRFACFVDPEEPGYNARRSREAITRMDALRSDGWKGPIVTVQHVPVFPRGSTDCPYAYVNAEEVIGAMRRNRITLAVSGHHHEGFDLVTEGAQSFFASPALCEAPYSFAEIVIEGERVVSTRRHALRLPLGLGLRDYHVHTQLAYCAENMEVTRTLRLAKAFGLAGIYFTEHSGQLYFNAKDYWSGVCLEPGRPMQESENRMDHYFALLNEADVPRSQRGLEIDARLDGSPLLKPEDRQRIALRLGAVHSLPSIQHPPASPDIRKVHDEFLAMTTGIAHSGIDILAHPFRIFSRMNMEKPAELFPKVIQVLRATGVAAEINFHTNIPPPEFFRQCLEAGVKISFGSDAHNLYEIGEFTPHLALLKSIGFNGDLGDIMFGGPRS